MNVEEFIQNFPALGYLRQTLLIIDGWVLEERIVQHFKVIEEIDESKIDILLISADILEPGAIHLLADQDLLRHDGANITSHLGNKTFS